ncbi:hypothetical protein [Cellulomonas sp. SG140]|uniref:phage tail tube protein n=1 Tax=Cellulomonas sp. SG140 TaxID=2976536 RepID=UPI0021E82124|nr:hypothetical protein [Cellulomonas sp. SG140]
MALNDNATLVINTGNYFTAEPGTVLPTDLTAIPTGTWESIGHTSLQDVFSQDTSGGDVTVLGTLQNKTLRTSRTTKVDTFTVTVQQFDKPTLKLYYGSNAVENADGTLGVPQNPVPTVKAFLAVFVDGTNVFAIYVPKAEILGSDTIAFSDTESLAGLPLSITPLVHGTNSFAYAVTPLGTIAP